MAEDNELKPLDISAVKSSTSRIDLSKATIPGSPASGGIRIGANPKKATSRIDINAIPGAAKAQTSRMGLGAMPPPDNDIYKRRTTLLDTSKIPLSSSPAAQPRTIRIGNRPTVRVTAGGAPTTFHQPADEEEAAEAPAGRRAIKLKRPGAIHHGAEFRQVCAVADRFSRSRKRKGQGGSAGGSFPRIAAGADQADGSAGHDDEQGSLLGVSAFWQAAARGS